MKVNEIIEQCNELLEDETYYLQTIELTKDEVKSLLNEIERLNNIIKEVREELLKYENDIEANRYAPINECLEILDKEKK